MSDMRIFVALWVALGVPGVSALFQDRVVAWSAPKASRDVVDRLNALRQASGLAVVQLDEDLSRGCDRHARYLARNEREPSTQGLGAHDEKKELAGWSEEGELAASRSVIAWQPPGAAVEDFMASLFHRVPLLSPALVRIGVGHASGGRWRDITVIDIMGGLDGRDLKGASPVLCPAPDAMGVSARFAPELPDPTGGVADQAGIAITVTWFDPTATITDVKITLLTQTNSLEGLSSSPDAPACADHARKNRNTVCFIPKRALASNTRYSASVSCLVNGEPWRRQWSFTTGP